MKKLHILLTFVICGNLGFAQSGQNDAHQLTWYSDVNKAYDLSKETRKPIFAFFTGSDWCGWCHKLQREVFSKPEFQKWANDNVVLLELDFPRRKELPAELIQQNQSLQQFFQVTGFPTIWVFNLSKDDATKKFTVTPLGSLGYPRDPEVGKEEKKFLSDANLVLSKAVRK
jgi:thioredoxin-related protein